jgi:hypothetical protein
MKPSEAFGVLGMSLFLHVPDRSVSSTSVVTKNDNLVAKTEE